MPREKQTLPSQNEISSSDNHRLSAYEYLNLPKDLRKLLETSGALTFIPYPSGLFPASDLSYEMREATGMGMAWIRDNAHVANALYEAGQEDLAVKAGQAMLTILHKNRDILDRVVSGDTEEHLPVRVLGDDLANDSEARVQNDSTGYALWCIGRLINHGAIEPNSQDLDTLSQTVRYLAKIRFWQDPDGGHWEEDQKVHASSIGVVVAGLREIEKVLRQYGYETDLDFEQLNEKGMKALNSILDRGLTQVDDLLKGITSVPDDEDSFPGTVNVDESVRQQINNFDANRRQHDAALLFLVKPLNILEGEQAARVVEDVETNLRRDIGVIRYPGDTYWEPRFPHLMSIEERTTGAPGRIEWRNRTAAGIEYTRTEAQWTLFDPILSTYWGNHYMATKDPLDRVRQLAYLDRSLAQLVQSPDGKLQLPEAYYLESINGLNDWIPNDHIPLLWSQANLLAALQVFEASAVS